MFLNRLKLTHLFTTSIVCISLMLSACTSMDSSKRMDNISDSLNSFRKAVRWGYYDEATRYIQLKDYTQTMRDTEYLKNIRITSYEYGQKHFSEDKNKLDVIALISFYDVNRGSVRSISEKQSWWFDEENKRWFLDGDIPDFTDISRQ